MFLKNYEDTAHDHFYVLHISLYILSHHNYFVCLRCECSVIHFDELVATMQRRVSLIPLEEKEVSRVKVVYNGLRPVEHTLEVARVVFLYFTNSPLLFVLEYRQAREEYARHPRLFQKKTEDGLRLPQLHPPCP